MISTIHKFEMIESTGKYKTMQKPKCLADYNLNMNGVDLADQYLSYYLILRKTIKWSKKIVLYLINCDLFNAFKIYNSCNNEKMKYKDFLLAVMKLWTTEEKSKDTVMDIEQSISNTTNLRIIYASTNHLRIESLYRLFDNIKQYILEPITSKGKKFPTKQYKVCSSNGKRRETRYCCKSCRILLHNGVCFTRYHTLKHYSSM
ncbi:piggyBac transposable element-derived protein 4-like [Vespa mandarinia]|uniref:piggyBac transposable element-derived protein 4-like n=1 Tax=Vespa mandarinia TaxID=7446 RepID=UPI001617638F|nr:piggyBac transposable element-derived protein 4-like [Vespa mandarinia]